MIGCNFCPFAAKAMLNKSIRYVVLSDGGIKACLTALAEEFEHLNTNEDTETSFLIFPKDFKDFRAYLDLTDKAEQLLEKEKYEGVYQLASFHPLYCFAGAPVDDPANYTNRSPYPMLQILREESITKALENFNAPESIPENNIAFARQKGLQYMQMLRTSCLGK